MYIYVQKKGAFFYTVFLPTMLRLTKLFLSYFRNAFRNTDPLLVAATCMYLACKIEECPHHIKNVLTEMRNVVTESKIGKKKYSPPHPPFNSHYPYPPLDGTFPYDTSVLAEFEFYLMEDLDF